MNHEPIRHLPVKLEIGNRKSEIHLWLVDAAGILLCAAALILLYLLA